MFIRKRCCENIIDAAGRAGDGLRADPFDYVCARQKDCLLAQVSDQRLREHQALVGLHRQINKGLHGRPVVIHSEQAQLQCGLQFEQP